MSRLESLSSSSSIAVAAHQPLAGPIAAALATIGPPSGIVVVGQQEHLPHNQQQQQQQQQIMRQLRCYLCDTPKQEYSLIHTFSEVVCRGCVNFEGPDRVEQLISEARRAKTTPDIYEPPQQQHQHQHQHQHQPAEISATSTTSATTTTTSTPATNNHHHKQIETNDSIRRAQVSPAELTFAAERLSQEKSRRRERASPKDAAAHRDHAQENSHHHHHHVAQPPPPPVAGAAAAAANLFAQGAGPTHPALAQVVPLPGHYSPNSLAALTAAASAQPHFLVRGAQPSADQQAGATIGRYSGESSLARAVAFSPASAHHPNGTITLNTSAPGATIPTYGQFEMFQTHPNGPICARPILCDPQTNGGGKPLTHHAGPQANHSAQQQQQHLRQQQQIHHHHQQQRQANYQAASNHAFILNQHHQNPALAVAAAAAAAAAGFNVADFCVNNHPLSQQTATSLSSNTSVAQIPNNHAAQIIQQQQQQQRSQHLAALDQLRQVTCCSQHEPQHPLMKHLQPALHLAGADLNKEKAHKAGKQPATGKKHGGGGSTAAAAPIVIDADAGQISRVDSPQDAATLLVARRKSNSERDSGASDSPPPDSPAASPKPTGSVLRPRKQHAQQQQQQQKGRRIKDNEARLEISPVDGHEEDRGAGEHLDASDRAPTDLDKQLAAGKRAASYNRSEAPLKRLHSGELNHSAQQAAAQVTGASNQSTGNKQSRPISPPNNSNDSGGNSRQPHAVPCLGFVELPSGTATTTAKSTSTTTTTTTTTLQMTSQNRNKTTPSSRQHQQQQQMGNPDSSGSDLNQGQRGADKALALNLTHSMNAASTAAATSATASATNGNNRHYGSSNGFLRSQPPPSSSLSSALRSSFNGQTNNTGPEPNNYKGARATGGAPAQNALQQTAGPPPNGGAQSASANQAASPQGAQQQQQMASPSHQAKYDSLRCLGCSDRLEDRHFVQCPTVQSHKFCFSCSKKSIQQQRLDIQAANIDAGQHVGHELEKIYCPSGKKCLLTNERSPWTFMTNEIETIFREDSLNGSTNKSLYLSKSNSKSNRSELER